jgi:hypothetical protein
MDRVGLADLLRDGVNRRDLTGEVMDDLGFSFALWNRKSPSVTLSGTVGAATSAEGILNSLVLETVPDASAVPRIYELDVAKNVFASVVSSWCPAWATWTSHEWRESQDAEPRQPVVGWMTYVGAEIDSGLAGTEIAPFRDGSIIRLSGAPASIATDDIVALRAELLGRGALVPIT